MSDMVIAAIIQARMGSTRLPGKVLKKIDGKPLIYYDLDQASKSKMLQKVIIATTTNKRDDKIVKLVKKYNFPVFRGSENDVLDRYYQCAKKFNVTTIVRITSDCPLIDPVIVDKVIKKFIKTKSDYCSNVLPPTYPDGMDTEVMSFKALEKAWKNARLSSEREHVTLYFWNNKKSFKINNLENNRNLSKIRLTVDQEEDFILVSKLYKMIKTRPVLLPDVLKILEKNPELLDINKKYTRNEGMAKSIREDKIIK